MNRYINKLIILTIIFLIIMALFSCKTPFPTHRIYYFNDSYSTISEGTWIGYDENKENIILTPDSFRMHLPDSLILK